jgi:hypothetical protein
MGARTLSVCSRFLIIATIAGILGGCAFGRTYSYADTPIGLQGVASAGTVAVGVQDARPYVTSGGKRESFVGLMRGGFGNPFDVTTQSGGPLAVEMRDAIVRALKARGVTAEAAVIQVSDSPASAKRKLEQTKARRLALVAMKEWKSDSMMSTDLHYDVTLTIFDESGNQLATNSIKGMDNLGGLGLSPNEGISRATARKLDTLFDDEKIVAALK